MANPQNERALDTLLRRQHGVVRRDQAAHAGLHRSDGRSPPPHRHVIKLTASVYTSFAAPATWRRQAKAAELSVIGSAVSHRAAAVLHGIPGIRPGAIDLTAPRTADSRSPLARLHRRTSLPITRIDDIVTTTLPRTVVDLAAQVPFPMLAAVFDDLVVQRRLRCRRAAPRARSARPYVGAVASERFAACSTTGWTARYRPPTSSNGLYDMTRARRPSTPSGAGGRGRRTWPAARPGPLRHRPERVEPAEPRGSSARWCPPATHFGVSLLPYFPLASGMLTGKYRRGEPAPEGTRLAAWGGAAA